MRTAVVLAALLLMFVASPLVTASGGHDEGTAEPIVAETEDVAGATSPELMPGESWSYVVTTEGTFDYHCHPHPWMLGQLEVLPNNGSAARIHVVNFTEPVGADFEAWTFSPKTLDVRVGDTVTWVNVGSVMHRVTQTVGEHIAHVGTVGGAEDGHDDETSVAGVAAVPEQRSPLFFGMPGQGWVWVGLALVAGVFLGRQMPARKPSTGSPAGSMTLSASPGSAPTATAASAAAAAPVLSSHARRQDKPNRRR
ncbi:MAG: hypothetical protein WC876_03630 [Candidatus Thermoplasmatota archaeon]|jgi:plastocyanin